MILKKEAAISISEDFWTKYNITSYVHMTSNIFNTDQLLFQFIF